MILTRMEKALAGRDLDVALVETVSCFGCQAGTIHFLNPQTNMLELASSHGIPRSVIELAREVPIGKGIAGAAAERREPVTICNIQQDASGVTRPGAKATGMEGSVAVPMIVDGELRGVLGVAKSSAYEWSKAETDALLEVAKRLASWRR